MKIPEHVAIIMDGNGRWAALRNLPRAAGHKAGCDTLEAITDACAELGIKYLTVYAFSTENWKRSEEEVSALMNLFRVYIKKFHSVFIKNEIRMRFIGDISRLDKDIIDSINQVAEDTKNFSRITLTCAINYGGRDEIRRAVKNMIADGIEPAQVSENKISEYLDTFGLPDPDLLIRTSGELRISNFLLWQIAYSEIYVTDTYWPDFNKDELLKAIESFNNRERRYGGR